MIRICIVVLCILFFGNAANAKDAIYPQVTYAIWNVDTGTHITGYNEDKIRPIASITKLMAAYVILRENIDLDEEVIVTGKETSNKIRTGMHLARYKLLELSLISSDNLAARTLAETFPEGYNKFIERMNLFAAELDMHHTKYIDSTGLLAANTSTAHDLHKLILAVTPFNIITNAANTVKYVFKAPVVNKNKTKEITINGNNTNYFAGKLDIIAAKTGFTSKAGRCLVMLFNKNGSKYLLIVMGAPTGDQRKKIVENLIDKIN